MNLVLVLEHRFRRGADGRIYASSNSISTRTWDRYLKKFSSVTVVARIENVSTDISPDYLVEYDNVTFFEIPYYLGPIQFLKKYSIIKNTLQKIVSKENAYICRLPSMVGKLLIDKLLKKNIPYGVEVVADPWEVFAPNAMQVSFSVIHRLRSYYNLKRLVKGASAAIYVTKSTLQRRYPANASAYTTYASNVLIDAMQIATGPKVFRKDAVKDVINLVSIGSLAQLYKSPDVVIEGVADLKKKGFTVFLQWLGDGRYKDEMESYAEKLGVSEEVSFLGNVKANQLHDILAGSDLYIHISKTEGLPRSLIEAMAKGLPCIGSKVGGIPELLQPVALIDKIDATSMADKVATFISNPQLMNAQSAINMEEAKNYENSILDRRRQEFYSHILLSVKKKSLT